MLHYLFMSPYRGGETCLVANQIQAFHYPFIEITRFNVLCIPCSCFFFERIFRRIRQVLFSLTHAIFKVPLYRSLSLSQIDENSFIIATKIFLNETFCKYIYTQMCFVLSILSIFLFSITSSQMYIFVFLEFSRNKRGLLWDLKDLLISYIKVEMMEKNGVTQNSWIIIITLRGNVITLLPVH